MISPHGRGVTPQSNAALWGNLPDVGDFAVVCPEGQGRRLMLFAWGYRGDIADLARMPAIVAHALPFVRVDPRRIYAIGSSMGGQEALLLLARDPRLLAGVAAFDSDTNLAARYAAFASIPHGLGIRAKLVAEVGGTPRSVPGAYAERSPIDYAHQIAFSGVPLQILVVDQGSHRARPGTRVGPALPPGRCTQSRGTRGGGHRYLGALGRVQADAENRSGAQCVWPTAVQPGAAMTPAQKRSLGLPADWPGARLALARQRSSVCSGVACGGSS